MHSENHQDVGGSQGDSRPLRRTAKVPTHIADPMYNDASHCCSPRGGQAAHGTTEGGSANARRSRVWSAVAPVTGPCASHTAAMNAHPHAWTPAADSHSTSAEDWTSLEGELLSLVANEERVHTHASRKKGSSTAGSLRMEGPIPRTMTRVERDRSSCRPGAQEGQTNLLACAHLRSCSIG